MRSHRFVTAAAATVLFLAAVRAEDTSVAKAAAGVREIVGHRGSAADRPENTLASYRRAIEAGAHLAEVDVRTTKDGALVCMHDVDVSRSTDGKGQVKDLTIAEIKKLDAGKHFKTPERVPTFGEVLEVCKGKIAVLIDLKETGDDYAAKIAAEVKAKGDPKSVVIGVRSVEQCRQFKTLLPDARQIGLVPTTKDIDAFAAEGVKTIRLWPKWLGDASLVPGVRKRGLAIHIGAGLGTKEEVLPLLAIEPQSMSSDDPAKLIATLKELSR